MSVKIKKPTQFNLVFCVLTSYLLILIVSPSEQMLKQFLFAKLVRGTVESAVGGAEGCVEDGVMEGAVEGAHGSAV